MLGGAVGAEATCPTREIHMRISAKGALSQCDAFWSDDNDFMETSGQW